MKYEIIKGSEKDFMIAPEWCRLVVGIPGSSDRAFVEALCAGARHQFIGSTNVSHNSDLHDKENHYIIAERLPITEPTWDGEGLPPVGVECEFYDCESWNTVKIKFIGDKYVVLHDLKFDVERVYSVADKPDKFRPIRSPEDVVRDEAIKAMCESLGHAAGLIEVSNIYRAIAAGKIPGVKLE